MSWRCRPERDGVAAWIDQYLGGETVGVALVLLAAMGRGAPREQPETQHTREAASRRLRARHQLRDVFFTQLTLGLKPELDVTTTLAP